MKKILALIIVIIFLTGCSVKYDLTINEDLTITEEVNMTGTDTFFSIYNKTSKLNVVKMMLSENMQSLLEESGYQYSIVEERKPYVLVGKTFDNVDDYCENNLFFEQFFEKINCEEDDNIIKITTEGFVPNDPENPERYDINDLTIAITSKYKVIDNNANHVDKNTNTYYWEITNDTLEFDLLLSFDKTVKFNPYINTYIMIFVSILIIALTWIVVWRLDKKEKEKKKKKEEK